MKSIILTRDFIYNPPGKKGVSVYYKTVGKMYEKVPEAHAEAIIDAKCGYEKEGGGVLEDVEDYTDDEVSDGGGDVAGAD